MADPIIIVPPPAFVVVPEVQYLVIPAPATGAKGEKGDPGSPVGAVSYEHTQNIPNMNWVIQHGLGYRPAGVKVYDTDDVEMEGLVVFQSENVMILTFDVAVAGTAYIS